MATKTTNYEFTKPNDDDYYDIQIENRNWDRADQQLKKLEEEKADVDGGDISETKIKTFDQPTEEFPVPAAGDSIKGVAGKVKKFFEDFKAFKDGVITVGRLVNNGLTTKEGFALDARYGKTLADAVAQLNSETYDIYTNDTYLNYSVIFKKIGRIVYFSYGGDIKTLPVRKNTTILTFDLKYAPVSHYIICASPVYANNVQVIIERRGIISMYNYSNSAISELTACRFCGCYISAT